jgi:mannose-6-phosphate isomerase-like protein (cupin superfamily)
MAAEAALEEVQIFDVGEALKKQEPLRGGRVDMAKSANSYIAVFQTAPRGGETHIHQHPDSDQVLFILKGELTVEGLSGKYDLKREQGQGVLIPAGTHYGFTNVAQEDAIFLSMRTESLGGRRVAYVKEDESNARIKIPFEQIAANGLGSKIYAYALDCRTIGVSSMRLEEWNKKSLLRMECPYEKSDSYVLAKLPLRLALWYRVDQLAESDYEIIGEPDRVRVRVNLRPSR